MTIKIVKTPTSIEALVGDQDDTRIFWNESNGKFGIKWKCHLDDHYYQQWLMWQCRAGKQNFFKALKALCRALRRENLVGKGSLRYLAS